MCTETVKKIDFLNLSPYDSEVEFPAVIQYSYGKGKNFTVTGLNVSTTYYFAIKTSDEVPNVSALSNVPSGTTAAGSSNLLANSGFESGITSWSAQTSSIAASTTNVHSGTQAVRIYNRTAIWSAATQDIKSILLANGQGNYTGSTWAKFLTGSDTVILVINTVDSGGSHWYTTSAVSVGTTYTQISGTINVFLKPNQKHEITDNRWAPGVMEIG